MSNVSIAGLSKAKVLAALYNASKPLGLGFMHYDAKPMTESEAQKVLDTQGYRFDYLNGRVMKIDLSGDDVYPGLYDRDNGADQVARIVALLSVGGSETDEAIELHHKEATRESALSVEEHLTDKMSVSTEDGIFTATLGLDGMAPFLKPHIDAVLGKKSNDVDNPE